MSVILHAYPQPYSRPSPTSGRRMAGATLAVTHALGDEYIAADLRRAYRIARARHQMSPVLARSHTLGTVVLSLAIAGPVTITRS